MIEATLFSFTNVFIGFCISWLLTHYMIPAIFKVKRHAGRATAITMVYTVAALIRNVAVYYGWMQI